MMNGFSTQVTEHSPQIAVSRAMGSDFDSHLPGQLRKFFRQSKYFTIEYVAMVGDRKYSVATVY